jgi:hypothetical protein
MHLAISDEVAVELFNFGHQIGWEEINGDAGAAQPKYPLPGDALVWIKHPDYDAPDAPLDESVGTRDFGMIPRGAGLQCRVDRTPSNPLGCQLLFQGTEFGMIAECSVTPTGRGKNFAVAHNHYPYVRVRPVVLET